MDFPAGTPDFDDYFRKGVAGVGDEVVITQGPFESFEGTVAEIDWSESRAVVEIPIFGQPTPVSLRFQEFKKTKPK